MSAPGDLLSLARTCLAASTTADDPTVAAFYLASARVAVAKVGDEVAALGLLVAAREAELVRRGVPSQPKAEAPRAGQ